MTLGREEVRNRIAQTTDYFLAHGISDPATGTFAPGATFSKGVYIPELLFAAFQATFAGITCCLIVGAFAERIKFSAVLLFMVIWFTFSYAPLAHMVWFWLGPDAYTAASVVDANNAKAGLIWQWGALDFAGGTVVQDFSMNEEDVKTIMREPFMMIASDSGVREFGSGVPHPRGYGNNARVLGRYVRELKIITLDALCEQRQIEQRAERAVHPAHRVPAGEYGSTTQ